MRQVSDSIEELVERARRFAALSGPFTPKSAVTAQALGGAAPGPLEEVQVLSALLSDCDEIADSGGNWVMRLRPRHRTLAAMVASDGWDRDLPDTGERDIGDLLDALRGTGPFDPEAIETALSDPAMPRDRLTWYAAILDRAGAAAPAHGLLVRIRAGVNRLDAIRRSEEILEPGFYGRERECKQIAEFCLSAPGREQVQTLFLSGVPGIGKSFLLEQAVHDARLAHDPIILRLDFDRRGLNTLDQTTLINELSRQLGDSVPAASEQLRALRMKYAAQAEFEAQSSTLLPLDLVGAMGKAVQGTGRWVLLAMDTMEVLRGQGITHPMNLFTMLDSLHREGVRPLAVLSAGRGDALDSVPERVASRTYLSGLERDQADAFLADIGVPQAWFDRLYDISQGNPLLLRLAAKLVASGGLDGSDLPVDRDPAVVGAFLYRAILSRIDDKLLRKIAHPGLILRRISAEAIHQIVLPAYGMDLSPDAARDLFDELCTHHWLVGPEDPGWVIHRPDVRRAILPLIYRDGDRIDVVNAINRTAATWFAEHGDPETALYHAFQATRDPGVALPEFTAADVAAFDDDVLDELPADAANAIRHRRGELSQPGRKTRARETPEQTAAVGDEADEVTLKDMRIVLERGDVFEAHAIHRDRFPRHTRAETETGRLALAYHWFSGRWAPARALFDTLSVEARRAFAQQDPGLVGLALLELEAEFFFASLVETLRTDSAFLELAEMAQNRNEELGMPGGALEFATARAGATPGRAEHPGSQIAYQVFTRDPGPDGVRNMPPLRQAHGMMERYGIGPGEPDTADVLPDYYRFNPYARPLQHLALTEASPTLGRYLHDIFPHLPEILDLMGSHDRFEVWERFSDQAATQGVEVLAALGLTSDWAGGFAFFQTVPNVPGIARAAARWRRTVAGDWSYGTAPATPDESTDLGLQQLVRHLAARRDPAASAKRLLALLANPAQPDDGERLQTVLQRRATGRLEKARRAAREAPEKEMTFALASSLAGQGLARPIAAALAVVQMSGA